MSVASNVQELKVGDVIPTLTSEPISPLTLALFAGGSGDHNPIHVDRDFAESGGFPDVFAHGMLSMAILGRALTNFFPPEKLRGYSVRFASITPLRARVTCSGAVAEILDVDGERRARLDLETRIDDGTVTLKGEAFVALD